MRKYSVMIVDDEELVRKAIIKKMEWEALGFTVAAEAENGEEALLLAEKLAPDIVLTDIKMPFMDGLTFCRTLKERQKGVKIVIFSGFDEFEYAKEAIKLEVEEYILKPIDSEELRKVFKRLKRALDAEIGEKRDLDRLRDYYRKSLPVMREQYLIGLLEGRIREALAEELNRTYELRLAAGLYGVAVFRVEGAKDAQGKLTDKSLLNLSLLQLLRENFTGADAIRSFIYPDEVVLIIQAADTKEYDRRIGEMDQICRVANKILDTPVTAGIGEPLRDLSDLSKSYRGALEAADYRVLMEGNRAIYIGDVRPSAGGHITPDDAKVADLIRDVRLADTDALREDVNHLIRYLKEAKISLVSCQLFIMEIATEYMKLARSYHLPPEEIFGIDPEPYRDIRAFDSPESLGRWIYEKGAYLCRMIAGSRVDSAAKLVDKAVRYIHAHYREPELSVEVLCEHLHVSAAYFFSIFKRGTKKSFVTYLTDVRMEAALILLQTTDEKTYQIAETVGYTEANYFSYVFKKTYGIAPSRYRSNAGKPDKEPVV